jgi:hypothetical protein
MPYLDDAAMEVVEQTPFLESSEPWSPTMAWTRDLDADDETDAFMDEEDEDSLFDQPFFTGKPNDLQRTFNPEWALTTGV